MLGPDIYHNSVNKGVISMVLEDKVAVVETRMLPGTAGGTVLSQDLSTVLGVLVPGLGEISVFALMYPLSRCESAGKSAIWRAISKVACVKSGNMTGSGVLFAPNLILTNRHVVGDYTDVEVRLEGRSYAGKVTAIGRVLDVAWVQVADGHWTPAEQATETRLGEPVYAIGYGNLLPSVAHSPMVTSGTLSKFIYHDTSLIALQTSAYVLDGQSGGALVNSQGQLLGLVTSTVKMSDRPLRTLGLCIALEAVKAGELWGSQEKWLREIFEYQNVDYLPRYRGKL
jgi:S1-C subfamily serine protease